MSVPEQSPATATAASQTRAEYPRKRTRLMIALTVAIIIAGLAYTSYYLLYARFYQRTDDAYVNGNVVQITPQITGTVIAVNADDTQIVQAGDPLVALDPAEAKIALQQAKADLAQTVRQVHTLFVNNSMFAAEVTQRAVTLSRAREDLRRRQQAARAGIVSSEELSHAQNAVKTAQAALHAAQQQLAANQALTGDTSLAEHPNVLSAAAKVRNAYLTCARTTLPAPVSGTVAKRSVQVGQRVSPGTPLMAVVPLHHLWVEANFKEGQLSDMGIGQPVRLTADLYGSSVRFHGKVAGLSAGTGSAFSLLPAQNATGNWIKVVQRVPVRIELNPNELQQYPLRIGLSITATVETRHHGGAPLRAAHNTVYQTQVFDQYGAQADAEIRRIIEANAGTNTEHFPFH